MIGKVKTINYKIIIRSLSNMGTATVCREPLKTLSMHVVSCILCIMGRAYYIKLNTGKLEQNLIKRNYNSRRRPGSSVFIATDYGLDSPGIEPRWGKIFRLSRPALGPTQPPVQLVPGLSRG